MKKTPLFLVTAMLITVFLVGCQNNQNKTATPSSVVTQNQTTTQKNPNTQENTSSEVKVKTMTVSTPALNQAPKSFTVRKSIVIEASGFEPKTVDMPVGGEIIFLNNDTKPHWPASDPHPAHTLCPGFDAQKGLAKGEIYKFIFTEAKTCSYHDHLNPGLKGTIIVK